MHILYYVPRKNLKDKEIIIEKRNVLKIYRYIII